MTARMMKVLRGRQGQMTLEFLVVLPAVIAIAAIAVNAGVFFSDCAAFDRIARNATRLYATSPSAEQSADACLALACADIESACDRNNLSVEGRVEAAAWGQTRFTYTLHYQPTLFGFGLKSEVFGVALPALSHSVSLVVDTYKPGMLF